MSQLMGYQRNQCKQRNLKQENLGLWHTTHVFYENTILNSMIYQVMLILECYVLKYIISNVIYSALI